MFFRTSLLIITATALPFGQDRASLVEGVDIQNPSPSASNSLDALPVLPQRRAALDHGFLPGSYMANDLHIREVPGSKHGVEYPVAVDVHPYPLRSAARDESKLAGGDVVAKVRRNHESDGASGNGLGSSSRNTFPSASHLVNAGLIEDEIGGDAVDMAKRDGGYRGSGEGDWLLQMDSGVKPLGRGKRNAVSRNDDNSPEAASALASGNVPNKDSNSLSLSAGISKRTTTNRGSSDALEYYRTGSSMPVGRKKGISFNEADAGSSRTRPDEKRSMRIVEDDERHVTFLQKRTSNTLADQGDALLFIQRSPAIQLGPPIRTLETDLQFARRASLPHFLQTESGQQHAATRDPGHTKIATQGLDALSTTLLTRRHPKHQTWHGPRHDGIIEIGSAQDLEGTYSSAKPGSSQESSTHDDRDSMLQSRGELGNGGSDGSYKRHVNEILGESDEGGYGMNARPAGPVMPPQLVRRDLQDEHMTTRDFEDEKNEVQDLKETATTALVRRTGRTGHPGRSLRSDASPSTSVTLSSMNPSQDFATDAANELPEYDHSLQTQNALEHETISDVALLTRGMRGVGNPLQTRREEERDASTIDSSRFREKRDPGGRYLTDVAH